MESRILHVLVVTAIVGALAAGPYARHGMADDSARISLLESTVQQLRIRLDEQQRRIESLENELKLRSNGPLIGTIPGRHPSGSPPLASDRLPWHSPDSWNRVTEGMSEAEVTKILGEPTAKESFGQFTTLFYRGTVQAFGSVNGHVNFRDGRVVAISKPAFMQ